MNLKDYIKTVLKRELKDLDSVGGRLNSKMIRILHASMGLSTESGEILEQIKKHIFYGNRLTRSILWKNVETCFGTWPSCWTP